MLDERDIDSGIDYYLGLFLVLIPISIVFGFVPWMRFITAILTSLLIIHLVFKNKGFRGVKICMGIFFLAVLWLIYFNLIPY